MKLKYYSKAKAISKLLTSYELMGNYKKNVLATYETLLYKGKRDIIEYFTGDKRLSIVKRILKDN